MKFRIWLTLGIITELIILGYCFMSFDTAGEVFRHAARFSGRLSFIIYIICLYLFAKSYKQANYTGLEIVRKAVTIFCILHFIHFGFLTANIYLNDIQLIPFKLAGGFLAYALILAYPFVIGKIKPTSLLHYLYFYYVGLVMIITYIARIKGDFEGASPEAFHYGAIITLFVALTSFTVFLLRKRKAT